MSLKTYRKLLVPLEQKDEIFSLVEAKDGNLLLESRNEYIKLMESLKNWLLENALTSDDKYQTYMEKLLENKSERSIHKETIKIKSEKSIKKIDNKPQPLTLIEDLTQTPKYAINYNNKPEEDPNTVNIEKKNVEIKVSNHQ